MLEAVGHPGQAPTCVQEPIHNAIITQAQENLGDQTPVYDSVTSLCLHRFYGGNEAHSYGGVCLPQDNGQIILAFPKELQSPYFSSEMPWGGGMEGLQRALFSTQGLKAYCLSKCSCLDRNEYETAELTTIIHQETRPADTARFPQVVTRAQAKRMRQESVQQGKRPKALTRKSCQHLT